MSLSSVNIGTKHLFLNKHKFTYFFPSSILPFSPFKLVFKVHVKCFGIFFHLTVMDPFGPSNCLLKYFPVWFIFKRIYWLSSLSTLSPDEGFWPEMLTMLVAPTWQHWVSLITFAEVQVRLKNGKLNTSIACFKIWQVKKISKLVRT